ncbi:hypothetical protein CTA1_12880 [Colletotrichum tanaceti]|uniref:Uncharacterized protein n=1 Tax=Colletotrichum tanaceti TaxID=1306861 RepID=A0A4U6X1H3_9PEZI|nr:hypothetical protein CTA1_12880 [Colletotrichum tanaceti]
MVSYFRTSDELEQQDYAFFNQQYATSTYQKDYNINPDLIVWLKHNKDVIKVVNWARANKVAVTPKEPITNNKALIYISVSTTIIDLNKYLKHNKLFVLTRYFSLFSNYIKTICLVYYNSIIRDIMKLSNPKIFYTLLSSSPSNFSIITYCIIKVYKSKSYLSTIARLNNFKGPHTNNLIFPCSFNLYVSLISIEFPIATLFKELNDASLFLQARKFNLPYVKRTYVSAVINCINLIYNLEQYLYSYASKKAFKHYMRCKLLTLDCFHNPDKESKQYAVEWQLKNDIIIVGPHSPFSKQDRRDKNVWKTYYEDEEKYNRLRRVRARADPNSTFTANPFAVTAAGGKK